MALGLILGTPCGSAIATGHREPVRGEGWGCRCGDRGDGDGGAGSRLELRKCCFRSAGARVERVVWALRPPRHWSRDWYFYFLFFLCDAWLWGRRWTGVHDVTLWVDFVRGWVG